MYGVGGKVTTEVKTAIEKLQQHSHITISKHVSGGSTSFKDLASGDDASTQLEKLSKDAEDFEKSAIDGKQNNLNL